MKKKILLNISVFQNKTDILDFFCPAPFYECLTTTPLIVQMIFSKFHDALGLSRFVEKLGRKLVPA